MKLFKFRSFINIEFTLDIIMNERLFCAHHQDLNDPFEGLFTTSEWRTSSGGILAKNTKMPTRMPTRVSPTSNQPRYIKVHKSLDDLLIKSNNIRVCSLSNALSDIRMWSHYADGHKGCAIEVEIEKETELYEVEYTKGIKKLKANLVKSDQNHEILTYKTNHWDYEKEYRILTKDEYFPVSKKISAIYLGLRVKDIHKEIIVRSVPREIPVYETDLNNSKVEIRPSSRIN